LALTKTMENKTMKVIKLVLIAQMAKTTMAMGTNKHIEQWKFHYQFKLIIFILNQFVKFNIFWGYDAIKCDTFTSMFTSH